MNLIKQNQIFGEIMDFYSNECRKSKEDIIEAKGSNKILLVVLICILKKDMGFSTGFLSEEFKCDKRDVFSMLSILDISKKAKNNSMYSDTYDYAKEKILKEFKND